MNTKFQFFVNLFVIVLLCCSFGVRAEEIRWLQAGKLHNWFSAAGCEIEVGRRHLIPDQQDGFRYPADHSMQDMQVAKGLWIGARNFYDPVAGRNYSYKVVHAGPRILNLENEFIPVSLKLVRRQPDCQVFVDGNDSNSLYNQADEIDETLPCEEMIQNVVNTSIGITITRNIYAYGHPDHENYLVYDFTFENTGIYDKDGNLYSQTLEDVIFFFQYRWAICKYMGAYGLHYAPQDATWGVNTVNEVLHPAYGDDYRASYAYHGLHSWFEEDNIGAPYGEPEGQGFLGAPQFPGIVTLHADKSATDQTDDPQQPKHQIPIYSDADVTQASFNDQYNEANMTKEYENYMSAALPSQTHADMVGDGNANELPLAGGGGVSQGIGYGPYTLEPGQSIHIVMAEAAGSLDWQKREVIGFNWYNEISPYVLPDGVTTDDKNEYKNSWVFTGVDSLLQAFARAGTTWQNGFAVDPIPPSPEVFEVTSMSDRILLRWDNQAESYKHFAGYRIYRAAGSPDSTFQPVFNCGQGSINPLTNQYEDYAVQPGVDYYYYIVAYDDGTVNTINSGRSLESSRFRTLTGDPAYLRDVDVILADVYVSPDGDDANDGLTESTPFRSIGYALSRIMRSIMEDRTIYLAEGIYSPATTGDTFPLPGKNYIRIKGVNSNRTIISADSSATIFDISNVKGFELEDLTLRNGYGEQGGGLHISGDALVKLSGVKITNNIAELGGGIYIEDYAVLELDPLNRCDIYNNTATRGIGADICALSLMQRNIVVDSFTVKNPCDYLVYPLENFSFDINAGYIPQIQYNVYIAPDGNDLNTGNSVSSPLQTLRQAIIKMDATAENPGTIHLAEGIYSFSNTGEQFPVYGRSYLTISGSGPKTCVVDAEQLDRVFVLGWDQAIRLENLSLQNGNTSYSGGGVYIGSSAQADLKNLVIKNNTAGDGGGVMISGGSMVNLSNVKIVENQAAIHGGGLYIDSYSEVRFDSLERCNIYSNSASDYGYDIFTTTSDRLFSVFLDTFTVYYPIEQYAAPLAAFQFSINTGLIPQVEADLYVSPSGSDNNSGLSPGAPLQTIGVALEYIFADRNRPHTIFLGEGVYSSSTNGEELPIKLRDYITIQGLGDSLTIIDGENSTGIFECSDLEAVTIADMAIINGYDDMGAGIYCEKSGLTLENVWIRECKGAKGAGLYAADNSSVLIRFSAITDDSARYGSAIGCSGSQLKIHNSTFVNNGDFIGGIYIGVDDERASEVLIVNSIFWENGSYPIAAIGNTPQVTVACSDISGGESKIKNVALNWLEGNLDSDPLFYLPDSCYSGAAPDIGRWGVDPALSLNPDEELPEKFVLHPNYPNPFNPSTTISYEIPEQSQVVLMIFDITGRLVRHLVRSRQQPGYYRLVWDGKSDSGLEVPSGQYFLLLQTDHCRKTQKMLFLK